MAVDLPLFITTTNTLLRYYLSLDPSIEQKSVDAANRWLNHFVKAESGKSKRYPPETVDRIERRILFCGFLRAINVEAAQSNGENYLPPKSRRGRHKSTPTERTGFDSSRCEGYPLFHAHQWFTDHIVPKDLAQHEGVEILDIDLSTQGLIEAILLTDHPEAYLFEPLIDKYFPRPPVAPGKVRAVRRPAVNQRLRQLKQILSSESQNIKQKLAKEFPWKSFLKSITNYCRTVFMHLLQSEGGDLSAAGNSAALSESDAVEKESAAESTTEETKSLADKDKVEQDAEEPKEKPANNLGKKRGRQPKSESLHHSSRNAAAKKNYNEDKHKQEEKLFDENTASTPKKTPLAKSSLKKKEQVVIEITNNSNGLPKDDPKQIYIAQVGAWPPVRSNYLELFDSQQQMEDLVGPLRVEQLCKMSRYPNDVRQRVADIRIAAAKYHQVHRDPLPSVLQNIERRFGNGRVASTFKPGPDQVIETSDVEENTGSPESKRIALIDDSSTRLATGGFFQRPDFGGKAASNAARRRVSAALQTPDSAAKCDSPLARRMHHPSAPVSSVKHIASSPLRGGQIPGFTPGGDKSFDYRQILTSPLQPEQQQQRRQSIGNPRVIRFIPSVLKGENSDDDDDEDDDENELPQRRQENFSPDLFNRRRQPSPILGEDFRALNHRASENFPHNRRKKTPWTRDEILALEEGLLNYRGSCWAQILRDFSDRFNQCRTQIDLKDKARNEKNRRIKMNEDLGAIEAS